MIEPLEEGVPEVSERALFSQLNVHRKFWLDRGAKEREKHEHVCLHLEYRVTLDRH
jgi:hypothetical protein